MAIDRNKISLLMKMAGVYIDIDGVGHDLTEEQAKYYAEKSISQTGLVLSEEEKTEYLNSLYAYYRISSSHGHHLSNDYDEEKWYDPVFDSTIAKKHEKVPMNTGKFSCFGFAAILRKLLRSLFCLPDDRTDRRFFHDLIISPEAKRIVKIIRNFCPLISRLISDSFHSQQLHGSQCSDDLCTCVLIVQLLFKQTIDQK